MDQAALASETMPKKCAECPKISTHYCSSGCNRFLCGTHAKDGRTKSGGLFACEACSSGKPEEAKAAVAAGPGVTYEHRYISPSGESIPTQPMVKYVVHTPTRTIVFVVFGFLVFV